MSIPNEFTKIDEVVHPDCPELRYDILQKDEFYLFDIDGDWYDLSWVTKPLECCKQDALEELKSKYNGTYYVDDDGGEKQLFSAIQEGRF